MLQIICNLILPGFGTLFMRKPISGILQLLLLVVACIFLMTVFMAFFGIVIWFIDLVWAFIAGIFWYKKRKRQLKLNEL